jgi:hypothetical protein
MMLNTARAHVVNCTKRFGGKIPRSRNFASSVHSKATAVVRTFKNSGQKCYTHGLVQSKSKLTNQAFPTTVTNAAAISSRPRGEGSLNHYYNY